jgi:hypothetical protein
MLLQRGHARLNFVALYPGDCRRGTTLRNLAALEDQLAHELMPDEERQELRDRILGLRASTREERTR